MDAIQSIGAGSAVSSVKIGNSGIQHVNAAASQQQTAQEKQAEKVKLTRDDVEAMSEGMNQLMESMNTDIQFSLHEKTKQLMVQVVDTKNNRVLKEFPPHEFLDMTARIREYVGALLDKKA